MHPVAQRELEENREAIAAICRRYGVVRLSVFGSATGDEFEPERSDFDFLTEYGSVPQGMGELRQLIGFGEDLSQLLGRTADITEQHEFRNPFFRRSVERSRREIFAI